MKNKDGQDIPSFSSGLSSIVPGISRAEEHYLKHIYEHRHSWRIPLTYGQQSTRTSSEKKTQYRQLRQNNSSL